MNISELTSSKDYYVHHTSTRRGYESRRGDGRCRPYKGRFGEGWIHIAPRYDTTSYVYYTYYIRKA